MLVHTLFYRSFSLVILLFLALTLKAQNEQENHVHKNFVFPPSDVYNAKQWIKTDCQSLQEVDLYNVLDSGYVIVQEYVMLHCRPCITAGKGLDVVIDKLKKDYPGRIKFYQTVFEDETNCDSFIKWNIENKFKTDGLFICGADEVNYYGGMGMPTIVVLGGGRRHKGYYKKQGYAPYENYKIMKAIKRALKLSKNKFEEE